MELRQIIIGRKKALSIQEDSKNQMTKNIKQYYSFLKKSVFMPEY